MELRVDTFMLSDDGCVPNHPRYPLMLYHGAFGGGEGAPGPDQVVRAFAANDWHGAWVNGIFAYHHYHATSHEVLANVGPAVRVQFGGPSGPVLLFETGMAVAIPAGCGHCRVSQAQGLQIVGAYPRGQENWDLKRADTPADYAIAHAEIARVARPERDPIAGSGGPLLAHWE